MSSQLIFTPATEHTETDLMVARVNLGSVSGLVHVAECGRVAEQTAWYSRSSRFGFSGFHPLASSVRDAAALVDAVPCECWPDPFTYCELPDGRHHHAPRSDAGAKVAVAARIENARWFPALWSDDPEAALASLTIVQQASKELLGFTVYPDDVAIVPVVTDIAHPSTCKTSP